MDLDELHAHSAVRGLLSCDPVKEGLHSAGDDSLTVASESEGGSHGVCLAGARLPCGSQAMHIPMSKALFDTMQAISKLLISKLLRAGYLAVTLREPCSD